MRWRAIRLGGQLCRSLFVPRLIYEQPVESDSYDPSTGVHTVLLMPTAMPATKVHNAWEPHREAPYGIRRRGNDDNRNRTRNHIDRDNDVIEAARKQTEPQPKKAGPDNAETQPKRDDCLRLGL